MHLSLAPLSRGGWRSRAPALAFCLLVLQACDGSNTILIEPPPPPEPEFLPVAEPAVESPPAIGEPVLISTSFDLAEQGYLQEEFFLSGTASAFTNLNELGSDGYWEAEPAATADYRTRVLVYRPADATDFSGTVVVEFSGERYQITVAAFTGRITEVNPRVDDNGLLRLSAQVRNPQRQLLPGMNVQVRLQQAIPDQLFVPKSAVVLRQGRPVVFVYQQDTAYWHYVTPDLENSQHYTITDGLEANQTVITQGNLNLGHLAPVKIEQ